MVEQQTNASRRDPHGVPKDETPTVEEAMLMAAKAIGKDGKGRGKLAGYFEALAVKQPKLFVSLLGRLLECEEAEGNELSAVLEEMLRRGQIGPEEMSF